MSVPLVSQIKRKLNVDEKQLLRSFLLSAESFKNNVIPLEDFAGCSEYGLIWFVYWFYHKTECSVDLYKCDVRFYLLQFFRFHPTLPQFGSSFNKEFIFLTNTFFTFLFSHLN